MGSITNDLVEVLIIGAGPTGLTLACQLSRYDIPYRIIDKKREPSVHSKALGIHARTLEIFESMGLVDGFLCHGNKVSQIHVYANKKHKFSVNMRAINQDTQYPYILTLSQRMTENILSDAIETSGQKVERGVKLENFTQDKNHVIATLVDDVGHKEICQARWIIACDGAHSAVRHGLNIPFHGAAYKEQFTLVDVDIDWEKEPLKDFLIFLSGNGLLGIIPIKNNFYRLILMSAHHQKNDTHLDELQQQINQLVPMKLHIKNPQWFTSFRIHRRIVPTMRVGRAFLLGDAAHIHSPVGGQGMNLGIQDAYNLAWKLALNINHRLNQQLLSSYHDERYPVAKKILKMTNITSRGILFQNKWLRAMRNHIMPVFIKFPFVEKLLTQGISGISLRYRKSAIIDTSNQRLNFIKRSVRTGQRIQNLSLTYPANNQVIHLYRLMNNYYYSLLIFVEPKLDEVYKFDSFCKEVHKSYKHLIKTYLICSQSQIETAMKDKINLSFDPQAQMNRNYYNGKSHLYVIRPDGYISYHSTRPNLGYCLKYLSRIFHE